MRYDLTYPVLAHPALGGAARIDAPFLFGRVFRMIGADATLFPNYGGRFGYDRATCTEPARRCRPAA